MWMLTASFEQHATIYWISEGNRKSLSFRRIYTSSLGLVTHDWREHLVWTIRVINDRFSIYNFHHFGYWVQVTGRRRYLVQLGIDRLWEPCIPPCISAILALYSYCLSAVKVLVNMRRRYEQLAPCRCLTSHCRYISVQE